MKLWKISQNQANGYDTYDSAIVAAEDEVEARYTHPGAGFGFGSPWSPDWATTPDRVSVVLIGEAVEGTKAGVILASFNAG